MYTTAMKSKLQKNSSAKCKHMVTNHHDHPD